MAVGDAAEDAATTARAVLGPGDTSRRLTRILVAFFGFVVVAFAVLVWVSIEQRADVRRARSAVRSLSATVVAQGRALSGEVADLAETVTSPDATPAQRRAAQEELDRIRRDAAALPDDIGVAGPAGPPGPAGADGKDGTDGRNGRDGRDGTDGEDGIGLPGRDGRDGEDGADGEDGEQGEQGPPGPPGPQGPPGEDGEDAPTTTSTSSTTTTALGVTVARGITDPPRSRPDGGSAWPAVAAALAATVVFALLNVRRTQTHRQEPL